MRQWQSDMHNLRERRAARPHASWQERHREAVTVGRAEIGRTEDGMNEVAKAGAEDPVATAARIKAEIAEKQKRRREAEIKKAREQESKRIESLKSLVPFKPKEEPKAKTVADEIVEEITAKAKAEEPKAESKSEEPKEEPKAEKKTDGKDDRPVIDLGPKDSPRLLNVVATAMKYLTQRGVQIFQRGGKLMMPVLDPGFDSEGHPVKVASLIQIEEGALQRLLMEHDWRYYCTDTSQGRLAFGQTRLRPRDRFAVV
jgi:hypothetical protein